MGHSMSAQAEVAGSNLVFFTGARPTSVVKILAKILNVTD